MADKMILSENRSYSLNCFDTRLNNNVIVVGTSGSGKTTGIVIPNLMQAAGSYIVTDPKGNLYRKVGPYLKSKGYNVMSINLSNPDDSVRYNFLDYISEEHDVIKIAHILVNAEKGEQAHGANEFFYQTSEMMIASAIAAMKGYIMDNMEDEEDEEVPTIQGMFNYCSNTLNGITVKRESENTAEEETDTVEGRGSEIIFESAGKRWWDLAARLKDCIGSDLPPETASCIMATIGSALWKLNTPGVNKMLNSKKRSLYLSEIGFEKTALFVRVSDTDRSMDVLANIFFSQAMDELCDSADTGCINESLPIPVRFIMDDFATNCSIEDFPKMISSIRSRNISTMIMLQSESQLEKRYGKDYATIINNCDTYVYMGGNDIGTAENIAKRLDLPLKKVLYMPIGTNWIFRRGEEPVYGKNYPGVEKYPDMFRTKRINGNKTMGIM